MVVLLNNLLTKIGNPLVRELFRRLWPPTYFAFKVRKVHNVVRFLIKSHSNLKITSVLMLETSGDHKMDSIIIHMLVLVGVCI